MNTVLAGVSLPIPTRGLLAGFVCLVCSACAGSGEKATCRIGPDGAARVVYLVSHGWHAGIVIRRADIAAVRWPELSRLPASEFLEVGWGDRDYYRTPDPSWTVTLRAALLPTPSVLHLVAFDAPVAAYFPRSEIIEIALDVPGFDRLLRQISASFARGAAGKAVPLGPGLYGSSQMYLSTETYHLFNTCNVWTARAIAAAGCPISPASILRVDSLMSRARQFGRLIQPREALPAGGSRGAAHPSGL